MKNALSLFKQGNFQESKYALAEIIVELPNNVTAQIYTGYIALLENSLTDAKRSLQSAPELMPKSKVKKSLLADVYFRQDNFVNAASTIKECGIVLRKGEASYGLGGGGKMKEIPFDIEDLSLGPINEKNVHGVFGPFPPNMEHCFGFRIGGLISHEFFRNHRITFDFSEMVLGIE